MTDTAELKPVAWRARRYGSSEWEVFGYDPRALKQFSFFEPLYSADALSSLVRERDAYQIALNKIDAIRNSIIGFQSIGWSEHIYPLVAALGDAGFPGAGYEASRKNVGTLLEQIKAAEARATAAEADAARMREALEPLLAYTRFELEGNALRQPWIRLIERAEAALARRQR